MKQKTYLHKIEKELEEVRRTCLRSNILLDAGETSLKMRGSQQRACGTPLIEPPPEKEDATLIKDRIEKY